ncbi:MAG: hypothetical protein C4328_13160, partial [Meiothermus sp.]
MLLLVGCSGPADTKSPTVTITQPADKTTQNTNSVRIQGTATDDREVKRVTYQLNGGAENEVQVAAGKSVSLDFTVSGLGQGNNVVSVNAYDGANNKGSASVTVVYQPNAPSVTITQPANNT